MNKVQPDGRRELNWWRLGSLVFSLVVWAGVIWLVLQLLRFLIA
jgi:hypothetical protein